MQGFSGLGEGDSSSKWKTKIEWLEGLQTQVEEKERRAAEEKGRAREGVAVQKNVRWCEEPIHRPYAWGNDEKPVGGEGPREVGAPPSPDQLGGSLLS